MTLSPLDIAEALVDLATSKKVTHEEACDSALALLHRECPGASPVAFMALVHSIIRKRDQEMAGMLSTPTGESTSAETIHKDLQTALGSKIDLEQKADDSLLGGAIVSVNDTRVDASVKNALQQLEELCTKPIS